MSDYGKMDTLFAIMIAARQSGFNVEWQVVFWYSDRQEPVVKSYDSPDVPRRIEEHYKSLATWEFSENEFLNTHEFKRIAP